MRKIIIILSLVLVFGCITGKECESPYISRGGDCCLDEDNNNVCDDEELENIVLVVKAPDPTCDDGIQNQGEAGVDCGGPCKECPPPSCDDGMQNQGEAGVDCGGPCPPCQKRPSCDDGIQNQGETWIDCGGPCKPCTMRQSCHDGIRNQGEEGVDCGGPCEPCFINETCEDGIQNQGEEGVDCGGPCEPCAPATCYDRLQNQGELGVDCGGPCPPCYCEECVISLTDTLQDGFVGDDSEPLDGRGDKVSLTTYNMVGDLADKKNDSVDDPYVTVIAFPITNITTSFTDARINVVPYQTQGTALDTLLEHIKCSGKIQAGDYSSPSDRILGVLIKASDPNDLIYSVNVTEYLKNDIKEGRAYSCYRMFWNSTQLMELDNEIADRRILYGHGTQYAPYLTYIRRPCIMCEVNSDCGDTRYITDYQCIENRIIRQYVHQRCVAPGTVEAKCVATQAFEVIDFCDEEETCINGEDRCFLKTCYDGEMENGSERDIDCGRDCRPCHCFNKRKDEGERGVDCGGECTPCPMDMRMPVVKIVSPRNGMTYNSTRVYLRILVNKDELDCWFSLNDEVNNTLEDSRYIKVRKGYNSIRVYCRDSNGAVGVGHSSFIVVPKKTIICPEDDVEVEFKDHFDKVVFFMDNASQIASSEGCKAAAFLPATTLDDSIIHHGGPTNMAEEMSDQLFGDHPDAILSYACIGEKHEAGYVHLSKDIKPTNETRLNLVLYFNEIKKVGSENSFWRVYLYDKNRDSVDNQTYLDIPYVPLNSTCAKALNIKYQELDLTPIYSNNTHDGLDGIELRLAIYSRNPEASLRLMEVEVSVG